MSANKCQHENTEVRSGASEGVVFEICTDCGEDLDFSSELKIIFVEHGPGWDWHDNISGVGLGKAGGLSLLDEFPNYLIAAGSKRALNA